MEIEWRRDDGGPHWRAPKSELLFVDEVWMGRLSRVRLEKTGFCPTSYDWYCQLTHSHGVAPTLNAARDALMGRVSARIGKGTAA